MGLIETATRLVETTPLPDAVTRVGIDLLVGRTRRKLASAPLQAERDFAAAMAGRPIAEYADEANAQHYELPPEFFAATLGPARKYSCCYYETGGESLAEAEQAALERTVANAALADGQSILELGCGWGSLSLHVARRFPHARIVAVSNSASQKACIDGQAAALGLGNLTVMTADMNEFTPEGLFDRVVSVEMFEHMANWRGLLERARGWLAPEGRLFVHVFSHNRRSYRFDPADRADWIARHFFTGGIMPAHGLIGQFPELFTIEQEWRWDGSHYQRTAEHWLENFDRNEAAIAAHLRDVYGAEARLWQRRWRLFYLATAGLFGHQGGWEWGVSHYRLRAS